MEISIDNHILTVRKKAIEFPCKISHTELFGEVVLVITDSYESKINENVWGVNGEGEIIWQIPPIREIKYKGTLYSGITNPYTGVYKVDERRARLFNWEGGYFEVDPLTGKFTKDIFDFRKGKRPW